jgi:hypothetical protein
MKTIGGYMFFFGIGSIILNYMEREFIVLSWIDNWGPNVGWGIRIGLSVVGAGLWLYGRSQASAEATPAA